MRGKVFILTAVVLFLGMVPLVSAYEAHLINVTAYVKERFNIVKTMDFADPEDINGAEVDCPEFDWSSLPGVKNPARVPIDTCIVWLVTITVSNPHQYTMTDTIVTDHFGAELAVLYPGPLSTVTIDPVIHDHGNSGKESFKTQYRLIWEVGSLLPGGFATLELLVWTKLNPAGHQEYTSPGTYTLNSGPTAKWYDAEEDGQQFSSVGPPLHITAY